MKASWSFGNSSAIASRLIVETFIEPTESAVPPIEFIKGSSCVVSDMRRQQFESAPAVLLIKKLASFHLRLCSQLQRANSSSAKAPSRYINEYVSL